MTTETWLPVVGYEGLYEVSDLGRVKSACGPSAQGKRPWHILKPYVNKKSYLHVVLWKDGQRQYRSVHGLVAEAFIEPRPPGSLCCHNDGNPGNNTPPNLRWDTPAGNLADRLGHGTLLFGERHGMAKLSESQVLAIRSDPRPLREIAADHNIHKSHACAIKRRRAWAHI